MSPESFELLIESLLFHGMRVGEGSRQVDSSQEMFCYIYAFVVSENTEHPAMFMQNRAAIFHHPSSPLPLLYPNDFATT